MTHNVPDLFYRQKPHEIGIECLDLAAFARRLCAGRGDPKTPKRVHFHCFILPDTDGLHTIDFERIAFQAGDILYVGPGQIHSWTLTPETAGTMVLVEPAFLDSRLPILRNDLPFFWRHRRCWSLSQREIVREITVLMKQEIQARLDRRTLGLLLAHWLETITPATLGNLRPRDIARHLKLRALVDAHLLEHQPLGFYADRLGLTPDRFSLFVKRLWGISGKSWLDQEMAVEAKRRLVTEDASVAAIGEALGFKETTHFVRFFKRLTGETPAQFRRTTSV